MNSRRVVSAMTVALILGAIGGATAAEITVATPDGSPVRWSSWVEDHAPAAVVLWASWTPEAKATILGMAELAGVARSRGLELVLVSVQEGSDEAGLELGTSEIEWIHDRYGNLLKHYRVVRIPALLIIGDDGTVRARLDATAEALRAWKSD